jgi:hypothetical protein
MIFGKSLFGDPFGYDTGVSSPVSTASLTTDDSEFLGVSNSVSISC